MSNLVHLKRARRGAIALAAAVFALVAIPVAAQAAPVNLATVGPFVALGGSTVTNTGPSVLNGDLGVAPGSALVGFGLPAVVNGATHDNDAVAGQAQADLTTAYDVAAAQPVAPANDLTGTDLGNRTLAAGAYRYTSSAQLTGPLTLDAEGDPDAQFVFEIAAELTAAPASSVLLVNGASPCNVFWQIGSSATLDTTTAFQGNLMALTSISLNNGASVIGRVLARNGQISLMNNVLDGSMCGTGSSSPPLGSPPPTTTPPSGPGATGDVPAGELASTGLGQAVPASQTRVPRAARQNGTVRVRRISTGTCTSGFRATVRGHLIRRVVFSLDGKRIDSQVGSPFQVSVKAAPGGHMVRARITFKDATRARTVALPYRACASAVLHPRHGPSQFTG
jgi:Ice-binding-like